MTEPPSERLPSPLRPHPVDPTLEPAADADAPPLLPRYRGRRPKPRRNRRAPLSGLAIGSLVVGLLGVGILQLVTGPLAIILGHAARREIARANRPVAGDGVATAGIVLGWVDVGLGVVIVAMIIFLPGLFAGFKAKLEDGPTRQQIARARLRQIGVATAVYAQDWDGNLPPNLAALVTADYLDLAADTWCVPGGTGEAPKTPADLDDGAGDFVYRGATLNVRSGDAATRIVVYTRPIGTEKWVGVWTMDGGIVDASNATVFSIAKEHDLFLPPASRP